MYLEEYNTVDAGSGWSYCEHCQSMQPPEHLCPGSVHGAAAAGSAAAEAQYLARKLMQDIEKPKEKKHGWFW
jgi:hypothetical protein